MHISYLSELEQRSELASTVAATAYRNEAVRFEDRNVESVGITGATANYYQIGSFDNEESNIWHRYFLNRTCTVCWWDWRYE